MSIHKFGQRSASYFRVLVVEDDPHMLSFYEECLRIFGFHKVTTATHGEEAIAIMQRQRDVYLFDFIITDWEMPGMSGLELLHYLRYSEDSPDMFMPVLCATGRAEKKHVLQARDKGATEFIAKPFTVELLHQKIVSLLSRPRDFILTDSYIGPTRRHKQIPLTETMQDRRKHRSEELEHA